MKKTLATLAAILTAAMLIGCASTKEAAAPVAAAPAEPAKPVYVAPGPIEESVCGAWNDAKTEYTIDLSMAITGDAEYVVNADGTADLTFSGNYQSIMFPIPYNDEYFMNNVKKIRMVISCDQEDAKKFAFKISDSRQTAWENGGGMLGQGDHCPAFLFNDYYDAWDNYVLEIGFGDCDWGFDTWAEIDQMSRSIDMDGIKSFGFCDNTTAKPVTYKFASIIYSTEPLSE